MNVPVPKCRSKSARPHIAGLHLYPKFLRVLQVFFRRRQMSGRIVLAGKTMSFSFQCRWLVSGCVRYCVAVSGIESLISASCPVGFLGHEFLYHVSQGVEPSAASFSPAFVGWSGSPPVGPPNVVGLGLFVPDGRNPGPSATQTAHNQPELRVVLRPLKRIDAIGWQESPYVWAMRVEVRASLDVW